jgi:hypothetical protein
MARLDDGGVNAPHALVHVLHTPHDRHVVARQAIVRGQRVLPLHGEIVAIPSRYSVQIGAEQHLVPSPDCPDDALPARFPWCFLNHSCAPNAAVVGLTVVAIRDIAPGEAVTFDYNTTEAELAEPFQCRCGSPGCVGIVRGATHLSAAERAMREPYVAGYLRPDRGPQ